METTLKLLVNGLYKDDCLWECKKTSSHCSPFSFVAFLDEIIISWQLFSMYIELAFWFEKENETEKLASMTWCF